MCGRFYADETIIRNIRETVRKEDRKIHLPKCGEIRPSDPAIVLRGAMEDILAEVMHWGFRSANGGGLIINARAESVFNRPMFRDGIISRRCVIPSNHFFEWNVKKEKVLFRHPHGEILYMAGIYRMHETGNRFTILTTNANDSMAPVHDRMPVLLNSQEVGNWIYDDAFIKHTLNRVPMQLEREQEYEQQSFLFE